MAAALAHTTTTYNTLTVVGSVLLHSLPDRCGGTNQYACSPFAESGEERREVGSG